MFARMLQPHRIATGNIPPNPFHRTSRECMHADTNGHIYTYIIYSMCIFCSYGGYMYGSLRHKEMAEWTGEKLN